MTTIATPMLAAGIERALVNSFGHGRLSACRPRTGQPLWMHAAVSGTITTRERGLRMNVGDPRCHPRAPLALPRTQGAGHVDGSGRCARHGPALSPRERQNRTACSRRALGPRDARAGDRRGDGQRTETDRALSQRWGPDARPGGGVALPAFVWVSHGSGDRSQSQRCRRAVGRRHGGQSVGIDGRRTQPSGPSRSCGWKRIL